MLLSHNGLADHCRETEYLVTCHVHKTTKWEKKIEEKRNIFHFAYISKAVSCTELWAHTEHWTLVWGGRWHRSWVHCMFCKLSCLVLTVRIELEALMSLHNESLNPDTFMPLLFRLSISANGSCTYSYTHTLARVYAVSTVEMASASPALWVTFNV